MITEEQKTKIFILIDKFCHRECFYVDLFETSAFCYGGNHYEDEFIGIAFEEDMGISEIAGITLMDNAYSRGLPSDIDIFTFSIFHEIGHSQTDSWWDEKNIARYQKEVAKCNGDTYEGNKR